MPFITTTFTGERLDDVYFRLKEPVVYEDTKYGIRVEVPEQFICDGPSVTRLPLVFLLYANRGIVAAVIHDYLYRNIRQLSRELASINNSALWIDNTRKSRKVADNIYYHALQELSLIKLPNIKAIGKLLLPTPKLKKYWEKLVDTKIVPVFNRMTAFNMYLGVRLFGWQFVGKEEGCIDPRLFCGRKNDCTSCSNHDTNNTGSITKLK